MNSDRKDLESSSLLRSRKITRSSKQEPHGTTKGKTCLLCTNYSGVPNQKAPSWKLSSVWPSCQAQGPSKRHTPTTSGLELESATVIAPCRVATSFPDLMLLASIRALYTTIALFLRVKMGSTFCIWLDTSARLLFSVSTLGADLHAILPWPRLV
jgi:hypothetical protein